MEEDRRKYAYRLKKKRNKRAKRTFITVTVLIAVIAIIYLVNRVSNLQFSDYKVIKEVERNDSNNLGFIKDGSNLIKYSKEGITSLDASDGTTNWSLEYSMNAPSIDVNGGYVSIADIGSKSLFVMDSGGGSKQKTVENPIVSAKVSSQGMVAVLMENKKKYIFELYNLNQSDSVLHTFDTNVNDGFIIDYDLSPDGQNIVVSYLTVKNGISRSHVVFYNFNKPKVDNNYFAATFIYEQTIIPQVVFLNNTMACAFGDNKFYTFSVQQTPSVLFVPEQEYESEIRSVLYSDRYIGFIFDNYEADNKYKLYLYSPSGKLELERPFNYDYNEAQIHKNEIIFHSDREVTVLKINGKLKFHSVFEDSVYNIFPTSRWNRYILVNSTHIQQIKLSGE